MIKRIVIYATNIKGLGTSEVTQNLLSPLINQLINNGIETIVCLDNENKTRFSKFIPENTSKIIYRRILPMFLSRIFEIFLTFLSKKNGQYLVLGDIPLFGIKNQIVFVQQSNLVSSKINPFSSRQIRFTMQKIIFRITKKYAVKFIVQSKAMQKAIADSYNIPIEKIYIISHPINAVFYDNAPFQYQSENKLKLFYPASYYPHKNHKVIIDCIEKHPDISDYVSSFIFTTHGIFEKTCISEMGTLATSQCYDTYKKCDALLFPSLTESYGLPLIEAMQTGMPIIVSDLEYAQCLCENQALYFEPENQDSLYEALLKLYHNKQNGTIPDYTIPLAKIHKTWNETATAFWSIINS